MFIPLVRDAVGLNGCEFSIIFFQDEITGVPVDEMVDVLNVIRVVEIKTFFRVFGFLGAGKLPRVCRR